MASIRLCAKYDAAGVEEKSGLCSKQAASFSIVRYVTATYLADGRYVLEDARTVGGGANWSGDTGRSGDVSTGT